ncbi:sensor domain-containing protein [Kitasatospora mediocidica]|uniref:sensor domain-containing protein n=1 Tax=Kitasatospora mediocidica TaxID=58352 RepID=UPI000560889F|nr:sensor domain-containing protein [Kitasatospora mediocidica]
MTNDQAITSSFRPTAAARSIRYTPFSPRTFRLYGYALGGLPVALVGFVWTVTLFALGVGTMVTALGLPVLALLLAGARGFGAVERGRARRLLGDDIAGPGPVVQRRPGRWGAVTARLADPAGWKAAAYLVLMFPWQLLTFVLTVTLTVTGWVLALYPCYAWVFPRYVGWSGARLFDTVGRNGVHHVYELGSPWQIGAAALVGIGLLLLTPHLVRALTAVPRAATRTLLG